MADKKLEGEKNLYTSGNIIVERTMRVSKAGKDYPTLTLKKFYLDYDGKQKFTANFYPSDIGTILDVLQDAEEENKQFIFEPINN